MVSRSTKKNRITKIERIKKGGEPRVLDLFSGCGGISLGFHSAGFKISSFIEIDKHAAETHCKNFFDNDSEKYTPTDITKISPKDFAKQQKLGPISSSIDVVVGGPPCQAYSLVGRAKLRNLKNNKHAHNQDKRGSLYIHFIEYIKAFNPLVILMENVPEIFRYNNTCLPQEISNELSKYGYTVRYTLMNSVFYGVPQLRERMFLLAYAKELNTTPSFPKPTHVYNLPQGYINIRNSIHKISSKIDNYVPPVEKKTGKTSAISAGEALEDLPEIKPKDIVRGTKHFDKLKKYNNKTLSEYATTMRTWKGFENDKGVKDHVTRYLPRDFQIFSRMKENDLYPDALKIARNLFKKKVANENLRRGTKKYLELEKQTVPPYDEKKFRDKWRKIAKNHPVRTLTAHLGKDSYSHIHYGQSRTISVREAARLQSFPDGFIFCGSMGAAFRQIGNSVPPLLAKKIAEKVKEVFEE